MVDLTRRQLRPAGLGGAGSAAAAAELGGRLRPLLSREELAPWLGTDLVLPAGPWRTTPDRLLFTAVGDTGSGGRQAMAVAGCLQDARVQHLLVDIQAVERTAA